MAKNSTLYLSGNELIREEEMSKKYHALAGIENYENILCMLPDYKVSDRLVDVLFKKLHLLTLQQRN